MTKTDKFEERMHELRLKLPVETELEEFGVDSYDVIAISKNDTMTVYREDHHHLCIDEYQARIVTTIDDIEDIWSRLHLSCKFNSLNEDLLEVSEKLEGILKKLKEKCRLP